MWRLLQHWTESSIKTSSKRKVSLEEQEAQEEDRFFRGRQIAYLICEYFRVTGATDSVENDADLITIVLRNDETNNFDEINNFFTNNDWNEIERFEKFMRKVCIIWKNWSDFKAEHSTQFEEKWSKIETLSLNSQARYTGITEKGSIAWKFERLSNCWKSTQWTIPHYINQFLSHVIQFLLDYQVLLLKWEPQNVNTNKQFADVLDKGFSRELWSQLTSCFWRHHFWMPSVRRQHVNITRRNILRKSFFDAEANAWFFFVLEWREREDIVMFSVKTVVFSSTAK